MVRVLRAYSVQPLRPRRRVAVWRAVLPEVTSLFCASPRLQVAPSRDLGTDSLYRLRAPLAKVG